MRIVFSSLILLLSISVYSQKYHGDSWTKVKSAGSGTLALIYNEQFGLISKGADGNMTGVCVDIISDFQKWIETKHGKKVNIKYVGEEPEFSTFLKTVQSTPNILGITNTTITEDRKKLMKFTPPFMSTQQVLMTHKNAPQLKSLSELSTVFNGFTAQILEGSTHVAHINKIKKEYFPSLNITYVASAETIVNNLSKDPKIFTILDFTEYIGVVKKRLPVKQHNIQLGHEEEVAFIMSKQSDWDEVWNEFLTTSYRQSVRYKEIIAKNLGQSFLSIVR